MSWLDRFFTGGIKNLAVGGVLLPQQPTLNIASGATATDNPAQQRSDVTITALAPPTGTGFVHITSGGVDAASRAVNLATSDVSGVLGVTSGGTGLSTVGGNGTVLTIVGGVPAWATASGVITFASLTALGAAVTTGLAAGQLAYVLSVAEYFTLDPSSTLTPDGITVIAATAGNWLRN